MKLFSPVTLSSSNFQILYFLTVLAIELVIFDKYLLIPEICLKIPFDRLIFYKYKINCLSEFTVTI